MNYLKKIVILLVFFCSQVTANQCNKSFNTSIDLGEESIQRNAIELVNEGIYRKYFCCDSIYYLIEKLAQENFNIEGLSVLYIFNKKFKFQIKKRGSRPSDTVGFHVVLSFKDSIFDFDFGKPLGTVKKKAYFYNMFEYPGKLYVREIPAREYLTNYQMGDHDWINDWEYYLKKSELDFPKKTLKEYLKNF